MPQPLAHQRILITRAEADAQPLVERLRALGAEPLLAPTIAFEAPENWVPVDGAIAGLEGFDWLVLTSPQGVRAFAERLGERPLPPRLRMAAVGPKTAEACRALGWAVALVPTRTHGEGLAEALGPEAAGRRFLLARGDLASDELTRGLLAAGAAVTEVVTYRNCPAATESAVWAEVAAGRVDWAVFASGSAFRRVLEAIAEPEALRGVKLVSIGPKTSGAIEDAGFSVAAEATESTIDGLVAALVAAVGAEAGL